MIRGVIQQWRRHRKIKKAMRRVFDEYDLSDKRWDDRCSCGVAYWERWEGKTCNCSCTNGTSITTKAWTA